MSDVTPKRMAPRYPERVPVAEAGPLKFTSTGGDFESYEEPAEDVADVLARVVRERDALRRQLADAQARCGEMVRERRTHLRAQVREFHATFGQPMPERPAVPSDERVRLRLRLIAEEFFELVRSTLDESGLADTEAPDHTDCVLSCAESILATLISDSAVNVDLVGACDDLADLAYVIEGTFLEFGVDSGPVLAEVQRSNLSKWPTTVRADGKVEKPAHYSAPDLLAVLRAQGYRVP